MKRFYLPVALLFLLAFPACTKLDRPEPVPAFIYIDHIDLHTTATEGSNSSSMDLTWIYVDDNPVGVFELPAMVPVLKEGEHKLAVYGGIKRDGIAGAHTRYPFYQPYVISNYNFSQGNVDSLTGSKQPYVTYYPSTQMDIWADADFEVVGTYFTADPTSDTIMNRETDPAIVFEGNGCGSIALSANQTYFKAITQQQFHIPQSGIPVYVELNYACNNTLRVGLQSTNPGGTASIDNTVIRSTVDDNGVMVWKKIYCDFTEVVGIAGTVTYSEIYFKMIKDDGVTNPVAYIDNVKLLYGK